MDESETGGMLATMQYCWKLFPITLIFCVISSGLYVAERGYELQFPEDAPAARRTIGGATTLVRLEKVNGVQSPIEELTGPLDVWDGEGWRIAVNAFMHDNMLHIGGNLIGLIVLGYWLESRINRWDYLLFYVFSGVASILIEFLLGNMAVGTSGAIYAIFGRLMVMRYFDDDLREEFTELFVGLGIIWLILCIALTATHLVPIANGAHFFGFFYGVVVGLLSIKTRWKWSRYSAITTFAVAHALIIPGFYFAMNPIWEGRFHWYRSIGLQEVTQLSDREHRLETAVTLDPGLARAWHTLALIQIVDQRTQTALTTLAKGVYHNRSDETLNQTLEDMAVEIHTGGSPTDQEKLKDIINQVFGDEARDWNVRLDRVIASRPVDSIFQLSNQFYPTQPKAQTTTDPSAPTKRPDAPRVDPTNPESAAMGVSL